MLALRLVSSAVRLLILEFVVVRGALMVSGSVRWYNRPLGVVRNREMSKSQTKILRR